MEEQARSEARRATIAGSKGDAKATYKAILVVAGGLFTSKGYEHTTVAEIAREAGVAVGTVYRHFADKTELLYAVKERWEAVFFEVFSQPQVTSGPYRDRIRPMVEAIFDAGAQHAEMLQLLGMPGQLVGERHKRVTEQPIQRAIKSFLDAAVAAGEFRPLDSETAAVIAYGMVQSALRQCFESDEEITTERYVDSLVEAFWRWVDPGT